MNDEKRQQRQIAEEKRRHAAILGDRDTIAMDFSATPLCASAPLRDQFHITNNPGIYAEDPIWKRFWKTEGIRFLHDDGSAVTDLMERFEQAFRLGSSYMEVEQENRFAELQERIVALQMDLADQNDENDLLAVANRRLAEELVAVKKTLKNYTGAIESL